MSIEGQSAAGKS